MATNSSSSLGRKEALHLSKSILLEESGVPVIVRLAIVIVAVVVAAFSVWASVTTIDEVAISAGFIEPSGQVLVVQSEPGGLVTDILVHDGQHVAKGQVLVRLDPVTVNSRQSEALGQKAAFETRKERLLALLESREPDFSRFNVKYAEFVDYQLKLYRQNLESLKLNREILSSRVQQFTVELQELQNTEKMASENFKLMKEELGAYSKLQEQKLVGKSEFNAVMRLYLQAQENLLQIPTRRMQLNESLNESQSRLARLDIDAREGWLKEMDRLNEDLARQSEALLRLDMQARQHEIFSPSEGYVHNLRLRSPGEVVEPGGKLLDLVPMDRPLVARTKIRSRDIGHLQIGQPVTIKVQAYDYARYGGISGRLKDLSPFTMTEAGDEAFYRATMELDKAYVGDNPDDNRLIPGMIVQADIRTGQKTIIEYLMKPIFTSVKQAFRER